METAFPSLGAVSEMKRNFQTFEYRPRPFWLHLFMAMKKRWRVLVDISWLSFLDPVKDPIVTVNHVRMDEMFVRPVGWRADPADMS